MQVMQIGPFPPPHGGVQTNLVAIRDHLRVRGHQAVVLNLSRHRKAEADGVYYPKGAVAAARLLFSYPADILHLHFGGQLTNRLLVLSLLCTSLPGKKSVMTFHSGGYCSSPEGQAVTAGSFTAFACRRLDAIIAVNQEIATFFVERCQVPSARVHLIPPHAGIGAALEDLGELPAELQQFFDRHDPLLLSVGLMEPEYDLPVQITALGQIRQTHPNAGLLMVGSGTLEAELRAQIAAQPFSEHLLLAGDVPHKAVLRMIRDCRMLLRTTHYDGDALSVREALELGTPVIATDNGMRPPGCHLIPTPPQAGSLCEQIEKLLASPVPASPPKASKVGVQNLDAILALYRLLLQ